MYNTLLYEVQVYVYYCYPSQGAIIQFEKSEVFIQENEGFSGEVCFTNEGQSTTEGIPLVVVAVELDIPRAAKCKLSTQIWEHIL